MSFEVRLPDIGEGVAEGEVVRWLVKVGDTVKEDQPLVEVMTDKASVEIPSPRTGVISALLVEEGKVVPVGTALLSIEVGGGSSPRPAAGAAPSAKPATIEATPMVRQLAREVGVAIENVRGTGPGGRITADDVKAAAPAKQPLAAPSAGAGHEERVPLRGLRRKIADHMRHSLATTAQYTFVAECDMSAVAEHRAALLASRQGSGPRLTYLAYVVKALVEPLKQFPLLNASLDDERSEIVIKHYYDVGIATATDEGLTVPVLRGVDRLGLLEIGQEIERLAQAARGGKLKLEELQGGTFTVTSTGARGGLLATPILHHPQVAILGVHEVKKKPVVVDDRIVAREMTNLSISLDHRVVDGAVGADFLYAVVARLQEPASWLAEKTAK